jgi:hypothetical protein
VSPTRRRSSADPLRVDFRQPAAALAYALNMAEEADARLTLLHVIEILLTRIRRWPQTSTSIVPRGGGSRRRRRLRELIPDQARPTARLKRGGGGQAHRDSVRGRRELDVIVMGVHGRSHRSWSLARRLIT